MLPKRNYFAADEGKNFICRIFIEAQTALFCVLVEFHRIELRIFSHNFLYNSLIQFFFYKRSLVQDANLIFFSKMKS